MNDAVSMDQKGAAGPLPLATIVGGRFQIQSFVRSECGTDLYQATDTKNDVAIALRLFPFPASLRTVLERDLTHAAGVTHKNLAGVLAWGYEGDRAYVASEAVDGATLREIINSRKSQNQVVGLAHAHVLLGHAANAATPTYVTAGYTPLRFA